MAYLVGPVPDERTALLTFLDRQRVALRATLNGLTEEQARSTPSASSLSLAGLLRHAVRTERRWVVAGLAGRPLPGLWPIEGWGEAEFTPSPEETVPSLLDAYAAAARETEEIVAGVEDLGQACAAPECAHWSARWVLHHLIEETARHAGHADIIRESLDGATSLDRDV
ncbi:Protein of unknown function (DUF664) [Streptoalloteichus tenebrarius]|uniref:Mini-circle protein n=2 Tax=Actinomycetes TaxID=1760 RepID=A0ABT1HYS3_STRSD|nr:DinB family protein [Streptoalloteichus tenebrarius]MCP2260677.1 Protein of unknown function (DUF664) [Streptoalloteichus tenebrarius]BFF03791.1 DinB family protein [Streptoalloteichus tenebrarius]